MSRWSPAYQTILEKHMGKYSPEQLQEKLFPKIPLSKIIEKVELANVQKAAAQSDLEFETPKKKKTPSKKKLKKSSSSSSGSEGEDKRRKGEQNNLKVPEKPEEPAKPDLEPKQDEPPKPEEKGFFFFLKKSLKRN